MKTKNPKQLWNRSPRHIFSTFIWPLALCGLLLYACQPRQTPTLTTTPPTRTPPPATDTPSPTTQPAMVLVRGYLAAGVGSSADPEFSGGIYSKEIEGKDIFLPGVDVYMVDPQSTKTSEPNRTDLSGRFTLYPPGPGRYQICWNSSVYGSDCNAEMISLGPTPLFLSTVHIKVPRRTDYVAIMGHVTTADGSLPRTFDPLLNINAFATVGLDDEKGNHLVDVYVNNFGDYLLPYIPVKQKITLTAGIESAKFKQEIWPEAKIEVSQLHQVNLKFENNRPRLDPLVAIDPVNNRRIQNAAPGSKITVEANARDKDGDPIDFVWSLDPSEGLLSQTIGSTVQWQLPSTAGRYSVTVVAYDNKGGYDKAVLSILTNGAGIPFAGIVVDENGTPVPSAQIEIIGNPSINTDSNGRFDTRVTEADRYVFNIQKEGYALNSQIYSGPVTGGRWVLHSAQIVTIDPTKDASIINDKRFERECPGPDSILAGLGAAGDSLKIPQWQDGKGNIIDPPSDNTKVVNPYELKLSKCGGGVNVELPANSILDASGNPATSPINVSISTVDLFSSQQMPGDDTVVTSSGKNGFIESFGAGSLDLPPGFTLAPGKSAKITIPVDRARLMGGSLPPTIPLLTYDKQKGLWFEEGNLTLKTVNGVKVYTGSVKHFSAFNADTAFTNNACIRVFSSGMPTNYDLEVMSPYPDGTPHYKTFTIDSSTSSEYAIYNITPDANITLAPMIQDPTNPAHHQLLGFYIVNSGKPTPFVGTPGVGNSPPGPPFIDCQNFVVLKAGNVPDSPFGGEFLHGLGYINALNLGFTELDSAGPTGNVLRDAIVAATHQYYDSIDPGVNTLDTLDKFKIKYGFSADPNIPNTAAGEIVASYANSGDLGFGRDMHCIRRTNGDIGCYVTNYGSGYSNSYPGGGTDDQQDADAAASRQVRGSSIVGATVAMEYAQINNTGPRIVKFFVYKNNIRSISANLDGRGERPVPQLCMICHGGSIPNQTSGGVPTFSTAAEVDLNARFLPFDYRLFTFPTSAPKASQDAAIKALNTTIVDLVPAGAAATDPVREVVKALYDDGTSTGSTSQILDSPVTGWKPAQPAPNNFGGQTDFYNKVVANACRTCHIAQPFAQLNFNTSDSLVNLGFNSGNKQMLGSVEDRVCGDYVMPHALRSHDIFWRNYTTIDPAIAAISMQTELNNFGNSIGGTTWKPGLCTSFASTLTTTPSNFYQQSIQPIWNAKCVQCHIVGGPGGFSLVDGLSYNELLNPPSGTTRVVPGDDRDLSANLLQRITGASGTRMPQGCIVPPATPGPGQLPCLSQADIDLIKAWIRSGAR